MRILVYGMGVIGGCLAHSLCQGRTDNEVTVLAREKQKEILERDGLVIKNYFSQKTYIHHPNIIGELQENDEYDIIFVAMQYVQMQSVITILAQNCSKTLVLIGNNMSSNEMQSKLEQSGKRVIFGFQGTGGERHNGKYTYVAFGKIGMSVGCSDPDMQWKELLRKALPKKNYRLTWVDNQTMSDWYASHLAFVLPVCYLCYKYDDLRRATKEDINECLDACLEGYLLLKKAGYVVLDEDIKFFTKPRKKANMFMLLCAKTRLGELAASNHAHNAVDEMVALSDEFHKIKEQEPEFLMPCWEKLEKFMDNKRKSIL